jgi:hypothetical protein
MHVFGTGQGCKRCANTKTRVRHEVFIEKATKIHGGRYDYSLIDSTNYFNIRSKLPILCKVHGTFHQRGDDHNRGRGCPKCKNISFSHKALTWLDNIALQQSIHIQHAGNGGEFKIPTTNMYADGFCQQTNTVYEFDGDAFHGNLNRYDANDTCHPFNKSSTAQQLFDATTSKHNKVRSLGYNLVTIWESDFDEMALHPINQYDNIIQTKTDDTYPMLMEQCGLRIIGDYVGAKTKHLLECVLCNNTFNATPISKIQTRKNHPDAYGCPKCNKKQTDAKNKNRGNYVNRLLALNYTCEGYINAGIKCTLTCNICQKSKCVTPSAIVQHNKPCCEDK